MEGRKKEKKKEMYKLKVEKKMASRKEEKKIKRKTQIYMRKT